MTSSNQKLKSKLWCRQGVATSDKRPGKLDVLGRRRTHLPNSTEDHMWHREKVWSSSMPDAQSWRRYRLSQDIAFLSSFQDFFLKKCLSALNLNKLRVITLSFSNANLRYALSCSLSWVIFSVSQVNNLLVIFSARVDKYNWWVPLSKLVLIRQSNIWILLIHRRFYLHFYINYDNKWWYSTK